MHIGSLLITGASRGLGLEFVKQLSRLQAPPKHIFAACRNPEKAEELQSLASTNSSVQLLKLDVTSDNDILAAVNTVQGIVGDAGLNVLFNNAGIFNKSFASLARQSRDGILEHYNTNVAGPILLSQKFAPLLKRAASKSTSQQFGCSKAAIINMSAIMASIADNPTQGGFYAYRSSKAALNMTTHCLMVDLKKSGIAVVALHPGWVKTDMGTKNAPVELKDSVKGSLKVLFDLKEEHNGKFFDYQGKLIRW